MSLHRLQIFASTAMHLSVTKAARELHISQPSVSHQLKLLQGDLGVALFTRNGQGLALTEQGQVFYKYCKPVLFHYERLTNKFTAKPSSRKTHSVAIGGSYGPSSLVLPTVMALFKKNNPSVKLSLRTGNSRDIEELVLRSNVELALISNPFPSSLLTIQPYREEQFLVFVAPSHPFGRRGKLSLSEFASAPLIVRMGKQGNTIAADVLSRLEARGIKPNIGMSCESPEAVKIAVREGSGVGILHQDVIKEDIRKGLLKLVDIEEITLSGKSYIIYRKDELPSTHAATFLKLLQLWRDKPLSTKNSVHSA